jgi:hypothetical protein
VCEAVSALGDSTEMEIAWKRRCSLRLVATAEHSRLVDQRLVLVCSRSSRLGYEVLRRISGNTRQKVFRSSTGSHTLRFDHSRASHQATARKSIGLPTDSHALKVVADGRSLGERGAVKRRPDYTSGV